MGSEVLEGKELMCLGGAVYILYVWVSECCPEGELIQAERKSTVNTLDLLSVLIGVRRHIQTHAYMYKHTHSSILTIVRVWVRADVAFVGAHALQVILQPHLHLPQLGPSPHILHLRHLERERERKMRWDERDRRRRNFLSGEKRLLKFHVWRFCQILFRVKWFSQIVFKL